MKLFGTSLLILTLTLLSACNKDSGGGGGGNGNTATQPSPTPTPTPGTTNTDPYDNRSGPFLNNSDTYQVIRGREFTIYNTDGMGISGCDGDSQMLCLRGGIKRPLKEFTIMSGPGYLQCINGFTPIQNIQTMPIRTLCQMDAMRGYQIRSRSTVTASANKAGFCASRFMDETTVRLNFYFDDRGILNFSARVGIGEYDYLYRATGIGYKFNARRNSLVIGAFVARGNNPTMRYLALNSLSGLRNPRNQIYNNMVLREARQVSQDASFGLGSGEAYQFAESILFRFSNYDSSQYSYQQFASNMRFQNGNGQQFLPNDPRFANVDPRFSNSNQGSETKFLVAGGNLVLLPRELLDGMGGPGGAGAAYVPFNDPRN